MSLESVDVPSRQHCRITDHGLRRKVTAPIADEHLRADPAVKALIDKTLKNLRFVEGGTFEKGDFGPKHSPDKLYYTSAEDNKPPRKDALDSYSMSAFKTTYEDYDVFSRAMG